MSETVSKLVFPEELPIIEELEKKYPERNLDEGARVTRVGPSPTGFMHIGTLYTGLLANRIARDSNGVCILRIEDTDRKREVEGATEFVVSTFERFGIAFDEGIQPDGVETGDYGPYTQSNRAAIYHSVIKSLIAEEKAYVCFSTPKELDDMRTRQTQQEGVAPGYYGEWAIWRDRDESEVLTKLHGGAPYVVRLRSQGDSTKTITLRDSLKGKLEFPENNEDIVIMKSDKLPTYHLAHVVDDHFMRTNFAMRGTEWLSSVPRHLELWETLGWKAPKYAHIEPINKLEGLSKRKLSKRKDPEASMEFFQEHGIAEEAVLEYLTNIANSQFDTWRKTNPIKHRSEYRITIKGLSQSSGPLFDLNKLADIGKDVIARMTPEEAYVGLLNWSQKYDKQFAKLITSDPKYATAALKIERGLGKGSRKDNATFKELRDDLSFFFDEEFSVAEDELLDAIHELDQDLIKSILRSFMSTYDYSDDDETWFKKMKQVALDHGFAKSTRDYRNNPDAYPGSVSHVAQAVRFILTGRTRTPDLHSIMQVMGPERVNARLKRFA